MQYPNPNDGYELASFQADLMKERVAPSVLEFAKKLMPIGSTQCSLGSKWGAMDVKIKDYSIGSSGEVEVTIQRADKRSQAIEKGSLFELFDVTDF